MARLVTVTSKALRAAGLAHDEASCDAAFSTYCTMYGAQHPDEVDITFVHVRQSIWPEDRARRAAAAAASPAGPGVAQEEPIPISQITASPGVDRHFVVHNNADVQSDQALKTGGQHGQGTDDEQLQEVVHVPELGGVEVQQVVLGRRPASYTARSTTAALPATLQDIQASRAASQRLGLRLPADAHGVCFADIERVAHAQRAAATLVYGGEVLLESAFGRWYCRSFAEACQRLNGTL